MSSIQATINHPGSYIPANEKSYGGHAEILGGRQSYLTHDAADTWMDARIDEPNGPWRKTPGRPGAIAPTIYKRYGI